MQDNYIGGYTKALLDVEQFFADYSDALKTHKLYNKKGIDNILHFLIENRVEMREYGTIDNIRIDPDTKRLKKGGE